MSLPIIRLEKAIARDPARRLQTPINFTLEQGEQIALIGLNGSGKSTLIEMITGNIPLQEGVKEYHFIDESSDEFSLNSSPITTPHTSAHHSISQSEDRKPDCISTSHSAEHAESHLSTANIPNEKDIASSQHKIATTTRSNLASDNIRYIAFRDAYGTADGNYYYQQRWNASDREGVALTRDLLASIHCDPTHRDRIFRLLQIELLLDKQIILLSSGELRRFQIAKMLLTAPRVLILESPFIGLDAATRDTLAALLAQLAAENTVQIILSVCSPEDIPSFITHIYTLQEKRCGPKQTRNDFLHSEPFTAQREQIIAHLRTEPPQLPAPINPPLQCNEVVHLHHVTIQYGERKILDDVNWIVRCGEKWSLSGTNGSGKSTLLSLICADNPQAYSQRIDLFGRRRGTGESIWEIKRHIGYVSPEMHRAYLKNLPAIDIAASGLFDSIGLYRTPTDQQRQQCMGWLEAFGIADLCNRPFIRLSSGEQRLVLLARAFVKDPDLLILDEPLHGLDLCNKIRARAVIETFCQRTGKTMIYVTHYPQELPSCVTLHKELTRCQ